MCPMSNRTAICPLTADRNMLKSIFMPALGFMPSFFLYTCCLHDSFSHIGGEIFLDVLENFRQKEGTIEKVVKIDRESNIAARRSSLRAK